MTLLQRGGRISLSRLKQSARPMLVLTGDDDHFSTGPAGFPDAGRLARWARGGLIHAAAGTRETYEMAVAGTVLRKRFLLVETGSAYMMEWAKLLHSAGVPCSGVLPRNGPHPVLPPREKMQ